MVKEDGCSVALFGCCFIRFLFLHVNVFTLLSIILYVNHFCFNYAKCNIFIFHSNGFLHIDFLKQMFRECYSPANVSGGEFGGQLPQDPQPE